MIIAQITDMHVRGPDSRCNGFIDTNAYLERAVDALNRMTPRPDVVIATGDLTDCGLAAEYAELRRILGRLAMPVYVIPGNHDRRAELRQAFADHDYLPRHGRFLQYVVEEHPIRLIGLDSIVEGKGYGSICAERRAWLAARLAESTDKPTVIFLHHPPFPTGLQQMDQIGCRDGADLAPVIQPYRNVLRVLAGHHHRPIQTAWAGTIGSIGPATAHQVMLDLVDAKPARIMMEPPAFHLHLWSPASGMVTHMAYVDDHAGPYEFIFDPDYPAADEERELAAARG